MYISLYRTVSGDPVGAKGDMRSCGVLSVVFKTPKCTSHLGIGLVRAWETAVENTMEDGLLTLDEENAHHQYLDHFRLTTQDVGANGAHTSLVQAAIIREVTQGIVPQRQNLQGKIPFNLMKSEQLVWVIQGVDYLETIVRRERQGTSHGVSVRVAKGLYYSPRQFRSRPIEWEETVHADTGMLGLTTKHIYFAGSRKKFRVRYDRIVSFDPYDDGFGIMRDAQTARPQTFRTGDGWFPYNWRSTWPRCKAENWHNSATQQRTGHLFPSRERRTRIPGTTFKFMETHPGQFSAHRGAIIGTDRSASPAILTSKLISGISRAPFGFRVCPMPNPIPKMQTKPRGGRHHAPIKVR